MTVPALAHRRAAAFLPLITALAALAVALPLVASPTPGAKADPYAEFMAHRHADAFATFAVRADGGDEAAAWMALTLVAQGPRLTHSEFSATPGQLRRWQQLAWRYIEARSRQIPEHDRGE